MEKIDSAIQKNDFKALVVAVEEYSKHNSVSSSPASFLSGPGEVSVTGGINYKPIQGEVTPEFEQGSIFYVVGNRCQKYGNISLAIASFQEALKRGYEFPSVYNNMGSGYKELGLYLDALKCYQRAIKLDPNYLVGYLRAVSIIVAFLDNLENQAIELMKEYFSRGGTWEFLESVIQGRPSQEEKNRLANFVRKNKKFFNPSKETKPKKRWLFF
jgi:tetratricopeptide (TPR) repeat protein